MPPQEITLACGTSTYILQLPTHGRVQIVTPNHVPPAKDPGQCIRDALDHPIGSARIEDTVHPGQKICIIVDDITRKTPVPVILQQLLPRLERAGIPDRDIQIVVALGSHRKMTQEELRQKVGPGILGRYTVLNSEFRDTAMLAEVGRSQMGTPIQVFRPAMEADIRIGVGTIAPHSCMGWAGGAKILYPGITSENIVSEFHTMQGLSDEILFGREGCSIRLAVEEWTEQIGLHYIVNTVLTGDLQLYKAVAGHYVHAHRAGVRFAKEVCGAALERQPDVILVSAMPLADDFWQCGKALYSSAGIIRPGGTLLLLAACSEGPGPHPDFFRYIGMEDGERRLREKLAAGETGETLLAMAVGVSMSKINRVCRVGLISDGVGPEDAAPAHYVWYPESCLQKAFDDAVAQYDDPSILIVTEGAESVLSLVT